MCSVNVVSDVEFKDIDFNTIIEHQKPCVFKDALASSELVKAAKQSDTDIMRLLQQYDGEHEFLCFAADANTRFFYNDSLTGFNYATRKLSLRDFLLKLQQEKALPSGSSFYIGSAELEYFFPNLLSETGIALCDERVLKQSPMIGIWLGNQTTAATHYDVSNNIAACIAGRRRFTLFPPEQIQNLYPGPIEPTPGGQVVSMVDLNAPDLVKFPKFAEALENASLVELEPGDVLVYPAMWWHQVEALADFNVLVNYWWNTSEAYLDDPMSALLQAMLSLRERPDYEKQAWKAVFDFYVFGDAETPRGHLPEHARGPLGELDAATARRLRAKILNKLNR